MTGLIWFVQLVHYPLMARVGSANYAAYQQLHQRYTTLAVGPAMLIELVTAIWLAIFRPADVTAWLAWLGLSLVVLIWLSTAILQVPCHRRLEAGFEPNTHRKLVQTNWLRTVLWSARGVIAMVILATCMKQ